MNIKVERRALPYYGLYLDKRIHPGGKFRNSRVEYAITREIWGDDGRSVETLYIGEKEYNALYPISKDLER